MSNVQMINYVEPSYDSVALIKTHLGNHWAERIATTRALYSVAIKFNGTLFNPQVIDMVPMGIAYSKVTTSDGSRYLYAINGYDTLLVESLGSETFFMFWTAKYAPPAELEKRVLEIAETCFGMIEEPADQRLTLVTLWDLGNGLGNRDQKRLLFPAWDEIRKNYSLPTRLAINDLLDRNAFDENGGRLMILHGEPGTGKTTLIRALAREWRDWCSMSYIVDTEAFFSKPGYLRSVIGDASATKWNMVVIEDAEEFLTPDAKSMVGQGIARLLNFGDGILGQSTKTVFVLTTNVPISKLHPAITRPGRCFANIEVPKLTDKEATEWLGTETKSATIAELYEMYNHSKIESVKEPEKGGMYL